MKYIFMSLLVLNLAYFASQHMVAPDQDVDNVQLRRSDQGAKIVLLKEKSTPAVRNAEMSEVVSNPLRLTSDDSQTCIAVGPFADVFSGQDALEQLAALDLSVDLKAVDVTTGESDFRLLIPPAPSAEVAFRKLRELQASDIDSYVITQGPQAMGISLGVFSTAMAAESLQDRLDALGYAGEIIKIERLARTYWLFPARDIDADISTSAWMENRPDLELRPMKCVES
ncbi:MAG: hypothetical protein ACJA0W_000002 [Candidatus Azotimanducaceae bacterium]|jgi:hypothetical protein